MELDRCIYLGVSIAIRNYLNGNKSEINPIVFHLLFILKPDNHEQVRVNNRNYLGHINKIKYIYPEIDQYIVQKGRVVSHYLIRQRAQIES